MSKWHKFHTAYSPVVIDKPNLAGGNISADWKREAQQHRTIINGVPLEVYAKKYNSFSTMEDVNSFFSEVILQDMKNLAKEKKEEIINYLESAFHQGGLMYPVSSPFAVSLTEYNDEFQGNVNYATTGDMDKKIAIMTTSTGFKIQENTIVKNLLATPGTSGESMANDEFSIEPDVGNDYIVQVQGMIDINFTYDTKSPNITIESNTINYGHAGIKERIDSRNFAQIIVDFFKNILGLNKVKDISKRFSKDDSPEIEHSEDRPHI